MQPGKNGGGPHFGKSLSVALLLEASSAVTGPDTLAAAWQARFRTSWQLIQPDCWKPGNGKHWQQGVCRCWASTMPRMMWFCQPWVALSGRRPT